MMTKWSAQDNRVTLIALSSLLTDPEWSGAQLSSPAKHP